ncbi:CHAT domain-containing protein [Mesorhizobium sp. WSM2561]|uniref:CHAT domain-containing protein n=1 Tax=Mesorhizobium sp. WSM2561 TaxID=1040985 RepID=UPI000489A222|nr:CHAT domain-containing protein [Mesorhizobium sp. WSM2561]
MLPRDITVPVSPYYRGALLARDVSGQLWVLNANGLFKIEASGRSLKVAPFPIPLDVTPRTPAALAVSATGKACVGLVWSNEVVCLVDGGWQTSATLLEDIGGSAVGAIAFTKDDTLIAAGVLSVKVIGANTEEFGPFPPVPFGSKHNFSAVTETPLIPGADIAASGGWGGTVFLKRTGTAYADTGYRPRSRGDQPYLIRQLVSHPQLGLLAGADEGLFIWRGATVEGQWASLRDMDPRLAGSIEAVAPSSGRSFWVASGSRLSLLELPTAAPQIRFARFPEGETIAQNTVTYHLSVPGLVGIPSLKTTAIIYDPVIPNAERVVRGPKNRVDLTGLADWTDYRISGVVTDGFLNAGSPSTSTFAVQLPFYQNPYSLLAVFAATVAIVGLLVTRRGPTGFLLRSLGGLKWSTLRTDNGFVLEVQQVSATVVRYELTSPSAQNTITLAIEVPALRLEAAPQMVLPELTALAEEELAAESEEFELLMKEASHMLGSEALPDGIRFITNETSGGSISLVLSKSLLWLPVELTDDGRGEQLLLRYAIGRQVSGDSFAAAPPLQSSRLKVVLFAPSGDGHPSALDQAAIEISSIASAARSWGAEVTIVRPDAAKTEVLDALCSAHIFHYAGHAQFLPGAAGQSYLPILGDRILAEDIATALRSTENPKLLFAFINGCGTSREARWERGAEVYGFASAFLNNASYFIGAQWPIHDTYAASIAKDFYAQLFPASYSLWWRLVRRTPLQGLPFAEALRLAQAAARESGPASVQTWSSYVFYGDPTQRLVLE